MIKSQTSTRRNQKDAHVRLTSVDEHRGAVPQGLTGDEPPAGDMRARIEARAYALYRERGCREGYAEQDWLDAEREIVSGAM